LTRFNCYYFVSLAALLLFLSFVFTLYSSRRRLIEIKNIFYKRVLAKTGSSTVPQLQSELHQTKHVRTEEPASTS
jgi:hypothetical protein